jgi:hypothetical protein
MGKSKYIPSLSNNNGGLTVKKMPLWKRIMWYFKYTRIMRTLEGELFAEPFNFRRDYLNRYYTIIQVTPDDFDRFKEDAPGYKKMLYYRMMSDFIIKRQLYDMISISKFEQYDPYNYLLIIEFKYLNIARLARNCIIFTFLLLMAGISALIIF